MRFICSLNMGFYVKYMYLKGVVYMTSHYMGKVVAQTDCSVNAFVHKTMQMAMML